MKTTVDLATPKALAVTTLDPAGESGDMRDLLADKQFVLALENVGLLLIDRYTKKDAKARQQLNRSILTMFANYDNKFNGLINDSGLWIDDEIGSNDYAFSVPLFKAHVDTALTFYSKTKPRYPVTSRVKSYRYTQLANMCKEIVAREYSRLMTYETIQREGQYALLGGKVSRHLKMRLDEKSRQHFKEETLSTTLTGHEAECGNCGNQFFLPTTVQNAVCPECLSDQVALKEEVYESQKLKVGYRIPRLQLEILNPVTLQTDFAAGPSTFRVVRGSIERHKAEFQYRRAFGGKRNTSAETAALKLFATEPLIEGLDMYHLTDASAMQDILTTVFDQESELLPVVKVWMDPCEYGTVMIKGKPAYEHFPDGLHLKFINSLLVEVKSSKQALEWVDIVAGIRPGSNQGSGLMHLAGINNLINNAVNLEYSVLRASGFPITVIREKYMQGIVPEANNAILLKDVPDDISNEQIVSRLPAYSASGMLGIMSQRFEQYMQYAGATFSFTSGSNDMKNMMGTATGASAIQEAMTDRLGLILQMRIQADIQMNYNLLELMQQNRTPELEAELKEEFDGDVVDLFFEADLQAILNIEAEKGSDTPALESLNVYKMQTFAQLTASLTGLREFDPSSFYDLIGAIGDSLNLPVELGSGRKEKHYANVQIAKAESLYQDLIQQQETAQMMPDQIAMMLFEAITGEEKMLLSVVPDVEATLFDHKALAEIQSDWVQSKAGIESPLPVKMCVVMMYGYHMEILNQMEQAAMAQQQAMIDAAEKAKNGVPPGAPVGEEPPPEEQRNGVPESESGIPDNIKSDGTTGPGRPREVDSPEEVADTLEGQSGGAIEAGLGAF